jgi:hypothetical protein
LIFSLLTNNDKIKPELLHSGFLRTNKTKVYRFTSICPQILQDLHPFDPLAKTKNTIAEVETSQYLSLKQQVFLQIDLVNDIQTILIKSNLFNLLQQIDFVFFYKTTLNKVSVVLNPNIMVYTWLCMK